MAIPKRFGPQYMHTDGSVGQRKPDYLRPIAPPAPKKQEGIHISEEAAKRIAEALRMMIRSK